MAESHTIKVKIAKAQTNIEVIFEDLPPDIQLYIVEQGLSKVLNAATAKVTKANTESEAQLAELALAEANKKLDKLKKGDLKRSSKSDGKVPGVVMTEARRLAKNIVKASIKAQGQRISDYEAKAITEAASIYLGEHPELIEQASASIEASKNLATAAAVNVSSIPVSEVKRAKNEAKKAEARAATEAKNAGKPGSQKSTVAKGAIPVPPRKLAPSHQAMH